MLVDSHCHLNLAKIEHKNLVESAHAADISHLLNVSVDLTTFPTILETAKQYDNVFASVGIHPCGTEDCDADTLVQLADDDKIIAIGETGLDYFHENSADIITTQQQRFRYHIDAAKRTGKPLIIHCREAKEDVIRLLTEEGADQVGGVMHCFVEDWEVAEQAMALGFYISFSGIVTFKSAKTLQEVAQKMPLNRMLVETDSPYLAPVPYRGKANQPAYVRHVAQFIADLRDEPLENIAQATTDNFFSLFKHARH